MNKISNIISILLVATTVCFAQGNKRIYSLSDCITTFSEDRVQKNRTGWAFWFIPSKGIADTLSVKMSCVDNQTGTHDPHAHFEDELFVQVKGTATVHLNGEEHLLQEGDAFYAPANSSHSIRRVNDSPIWYVMFKRETPGGLKVPFLPAKKEYTMADCLIPSNHSSLVLKKDEYTMWYLTKEMTAGGLNAELHIPTDASIHTIDKSPDQAVCFILEGKAKVTINGESRVVEALSSCYCPTEALCSIQKEGDTKLEYIVVRTK